jgi:hypothetical protein
MGRIVARFLVLLLLAAALLLRPWERASDEPEAPPEPSFSLPAAPLPELPPPPAPAAVGTYLLRTDQQRTRLVLDEAGRFQMLSERFDGKGERSSRGLWRQDGVVVEMTYTEMDGTPAQEPYVVARNQLFEEGLVMIVGEKRVLLSRVVKIDPR